MSSDSWIISWQIGKFFPAESPRLPLAPDCHAAVDPPWISSRRAAFSPPSPLPSARFACPAISIQPSTFPQLQDCRRSISSPRFPLLVFSGGQSHAGSFSNRARRACHGCHKRRRLQPRPDALATEPGDGAARCGRHQPPGADPFLGPLVQALRALG